MVHLIPPKRMFIQKSKRKGGGQHERTSLLTKPKEEDCHKSDPNQTSWRASTRMSTSRVLGRSNAPLVAVRVAAVVVVALGEAAPVVVPLSGGNNVGGGNNHIAAVAAVGASSLGDGGSLESGGRGLSSAGGRSRNSGRELGSGGLGLNGRRHGRSSAIVLLLAGAEGHSDGGVSGASLHAVGIIGSVAVSLLLGSARRGVGSDLPVAIPGVSVDLAQVVPDSSVVLVGVLVLKDVLQGSAVGELDGPAVSVAERGPGLSVGVVGRQSLVNLGVTTVRGRDVDKSNIVVALVNDDGTSNVVSGGSGHQGGSSENRVLHVDDWGCCIDALALSSTVVKSR